MRKKINFVIILLISLVFTLTFSAMAVPKLINYQGQLTDTNGNLLNGVYIAKFYLYCEEIGGSPLWIEQQELTVTNGIYNVQLGAVNTLDAHFFDNESLYLEVEIFNPGKGWETLSPRQHITSTAFAINADMLDGKHASEFIVPQGAIILWRGSSCPTGYSRVTELDGKFLASGSTYNKDAGGSNTHTHGAGSYGVGNHTLTIAEMPAHTHSNYDYHYHNEADGLSGAYKSRTPSTTGSTGGDQPHNHPFSGTSATADSRPEFATILLCEKD